MKEKKGFIIAIVALVLIVAGLVAYIVIDKNKGKNEKSEEVTTQATTEAVEDKASEDDAKEATTEEKKESAKTEKKMACYATIAAENNWQDGDKFVYQFTVDIGKQCFMKMPRLLYM